MKNFICVLLALSTFTSAHAARKQYSSSSRPKMGKHLYKESTGHCYYNEKVQKTKIGWKSQEEMSRMSVRQVQFIKLPRTAVNTRKVYVSKNRCAVAERNTQRVRN